MPTAKVSLSKMTVFRYLQSANRC